MDVVCFGITGDVDGGFVDSMKVFSCFLKFFYEVIIKQLTLF